MKWTTLLLLPLLLYLVQGQQQKIFNFLDYKNVSLENSGWLVLKQDESNPITLPLQYSLCVRVFKWYERLKYQSFGTINLIDEFSNITDEYTHGVSWSGTYMMQQFLNWIFRVKVVQIWQPMNGLMFAIVWISRITLSKQSWTGNFLMMELVAK